MNFEQINSNLYEQISEILSQVYLWNTLWDYLIAFIVFLLIYFFVKIFRSIIISRLEKFSSSTSIEFDEFIVDNIKSLPSYFFWTLYIYFPLKYLSINPIADNAINIIFLIVILLQLIRIWINFIQYFLKTAILTDSEDEDNLTTYNLLVLISKIVIWATAVLFFLMNLWFEITPLLASLWIWGVAVAFALQNILQDIFSSISIYLDKPFKIWDFISVAGEFGTVKKIWIKTTRIKTLQWQQLVVSNKEMTDAKINNYGIMNNRRIVLKIWVTYETELEKLKKIPEMIRNIFEKQEISDNTNLLRVHFHEFWDYSLNYEIVYNILTSDYNVYMDIQEIINFALIEEFQKEWIQFAYPTYKIVNNDK